MKLEAEIRTCPSTDHTLHLYELGKLATSYSTELEAFLKCLEGTVAADKGHALSLAIFFKNEYIFFKDLCDEIRTVTSEVSPKVLVTIRA